MKKQFNSQPRFQAAPQVGEIWLAKFHFDDDRSKYKVRPVFVLDARPFGVTVAFCGTQKLEETSSRTDVLLSDEEAIRLGMFRAGKISFGRRETLSMGDFHRCLGSIGTPGEKLSLLKFREIAEAVRAAGIM